jgi:hypothetical protein
MGTEIKGTRVLGVIGRQLKQDEGRVLECRLLLGLFRHLDVHLTPVG